MSRLFPTPAFTRSLLSLTLPPPALQPGVRRIILAVLVVGLGLAIAWLPPAQTILLLAGSLLAGLTLVRPVLTLYLLVPLIPFSPLVSVTVGGFRVGGMELVLAWALVTWLLQLLTRRPNRVEALPRPLAARYPLLLPFLLLLGGVGLSWLNSLSLGASLVETAKWLEMLAVYLFIVAVLPDRQIGWVAAAILLTGAAQALLGLYQFVFKVGPEGFLLFGGSFLRAYGTFAQPNPYAGYLGLVLPLALALGVWGLTGKLGRRHPLVLMALPVLGLLLAALFASQSRSGWLGFAAAALVILLVHSRKMALLLVSLALVAALAGLAGAFQSSLPLPGTGPLGQAYTSVVERLGAAVSIAAIRDIAAVEVNDANFATIERLAHWQAAREMWRDHPWLGVGFGNYEVIYPVYVVGRWANPLGHAHNYLLNIGAETGLVGITAYLIFWILVFLVTYLAIRRSTGLPQAIAAGGLGILAHLHVHNLFDNLYVQGMYLHVAIILALISIVWCQADAPPDPLRRPETGRQCR